MNIGVARIHQGLYSLILPTSHKTNTLDNVPHPNKHVSQTCSLWRNRLGHPSHDTLNHINKISLCLNCLNLVYLVMLALMLNKNVFLFLIVILELKNILNLCIWIFGALFLLFLYLAINIFLTVINDYSRYCWIFHMKAKSETSILIKSFVKLIQTQFNSTIKIIRSDNGPEFF